MQECGDRVRRRAWTILLEHPLLVRSPLSPVISGAAVQRAWSRRLQAPNDSYTPPADFVAGG
jgi:hypothetical protein